MGLWENFGLGPSLGSLQQWYFEGLVRCRRPRHPRTFVSRSILAADSSLRLKLVLSYSTVQYRSKGLPFSLFSFPEMLVVIATSGVVGSRDLHERRIPNLLPTSRSFNFPLPGQTGGTRLLCPAASPCRVVPYHRIQLLLDLTKS
jgi:hypothetical protein